uniref:Uncharacterized protein n=1 Tax=Nicotiana sylvestris TaxID=4096 RepID=A0A1U7WMN2_NICSY
MAAGCCVFCFTTVAPATSVERPWLLVAASSASSPASSSSPHVQHGESATPYQATTQSPPSRQYITKQTSHLPSFSSPRAPVNPWLLLPRRSPADQNVSPSMLPHLASGSTTRLNHPLSVQSNNETQPSRLFELWSGFVEAVHTQSRSSSCSASRLPFKPTPLI